ncbi:MAG: hypothetical protein WB995_12495 [Candidatus Acidiferrales bacterium]
MRKLIQDLIYARRQFTRTPGVAITAIISLALGIGATTAVFSVVYGVLGDPYPYRDADRMVHVQLNLPERRGPLLMVTGPQYDDLRKLSAIDDVFLQTDELGDRPVSRVRAKGFHCPEMGTAKQRLTG